jgi:hypothetical protein
VEELTLEAICNQDNFKSIKIMSIAELLNPNSPGYVDALKMDKAIQLAREAGMEEDALALQNTAIQLINVAKGASSSKVRSEAERNFKSLFGKSIEMQNQVASFRNRQQEEQKKAALIQATANEFGAKFKQAQEKGITIDPKVTQSISNLLGTGQVEEARKVADNILAAQPQAEKAEYKKSAADLTFEQNAASAIRYANQLEDTVKKYGTWESARLGDPAAAAKLGQLPYQLAISYAKVVDPSSVVRESEVEMAQKYMVPTGFWASQEKSLAAIKNFQEDIKNKVDAYKQSTGADFSIDFEAGKTKEEEDKTKKIDQINSYFRSR